MMRKIILLNPQKVAPFNEPARELRIVNKPLWLYQRDVLARHCSMELEVKSLEKAPRDEQETLLYRDNLFFDHELVDTFIREARASGQARQVAFSLDDRAIATHALPLQGGIRRQGDVYVADLWYYPRGLTECAEPLVISTGAKEIGYYHVPSYIASEKGELVYYVPLRAFLSIENWVHVYMANSPFGIFSWGARMERDVERFSVKTRIFLRSLLERKKFLSSSAMVHVGRDCQIDPSAVIQGPTYIGDHVTVGPGVVIGNCVIGNNVNVMQGCQLMLSVVGDGCYLPFRAALFMSTLMENSMVAQNACLQCCVVGRNSFIGAGTTFTDFNLLSEPIKTMRDGRLESTGLSVLGGCVGHNCRVGSDLTIFPGRTIESDCVVIRSDQRAVVNRNVSFENSDHHGLPGCEVHPRLYPRE
jgi:UDP-N-acetylglucosamine diphosphorylase / glucose-1-phosphate thymidylyltransferase / UDP-N-acetylgalactosamine diphosphorylase / glucosamine-1-phosphate N-acetyltransferase / galactosamine-1-phosphate N-acetyltransferase